MKTLVGFPSGWNIDLQRPLLNTADVLLDRLVNPGNGQAVLKERCGYRGAENRCEVCDEYPEFIQDGDDLGSVAVAVA